MPGKKVLIVDDSDTIRSQVAAVLAPAGFVVIEAADGLDGLERAEQNELCLLIADLNMPRLDGLGMLERLKQNPKHADLPVLVLTTELEPAQIQRAKKAGARGWMVKPVKANQLLSAVQKLAK